MHRFLARSRASLLPKRQGLELHQQELMNGLAADESNSALYRCGLKKAVIKLFNRLPERITRIEDHRDHPNFETFLYHGIGRADGELCRRCA